MISRSLSTCLLLASLLALAGCAQPGGAPTRQPPPAASPPQAEAVTVTDGAPTATPTRPAVATRAVTPSATPCAYDYFFTPAPPTCPREAPVATAAAEQPFTGGVMIWLEATQSITVFFPDGRWQSYADTWTEDEAESDPAPSPPAGFFQPIRGFGKVWREHPALQERLGWATSVELGYTAAMQRPISEAGEQITFLRTYNGQVYYLQELAPGRGTWGIAASG